MEYYDFCAAENLEIYWCELNYPVELDIRRQSLPVRQRAIEEIDQVVAKYSSQPGLSTDALNRYRMTLENPSYTNNNYVEFKSQDTVAWTAVTEAKLKKTQTFQDLWPELQKMITSC
jgi:hypothetical protein